MRPDRLVYVLGAGFSADAGPPTIGAFLQSAREYFDAPSSPLPEYLEPHYKTVFQFRQAAKRSRDSLRLDLDDIENLFSLIDMESLARPRSLEARKTADSIKHVIADTVTHKRSALRQFDVTIDSERLGGLRVPGSPLENFQIGHVVGPGITLFRLDQYLFMASLIAGLFEPRERNVSDSVITFNYDTVLEESVSRLGGRVDYRVSRMQSEASEGSTAPAFVVPVFKLHGSSNWAKPSQRGVRGRIFPSYRGFGERFVPMVVPPTWKKGDLAPLFAEIWRGAREALVKATRICIVGYSMRITDPFFHHLMASALGENEGLYRLDVVDLAPAGSGEVLMKRYRDIFEPLDSYGRLHFHMNGLAHFLSSRDEFPNALGRGHAIREVTRY